MRLSLLTKLRQRLSYLSVACALAAVWMCAQAATPRAVADPVRPPAVPLVAHDPYFSIWSPADQLYGEETTHWTGKPHPLHALVRVDGEVARVMGAQPAHIAPLPQKSVEVLPTRTIYTFANAKIQLTLTFVTPALTDDLDILSRPATYVVWEAVAVDGKAHSVQFYLDASPMLAVNEGKQDVVCEKAEVKGLQAVRVGSREQKLLSRPGDDIRIDWGYAYLAVPADQKGGAVAIARANDAYDHFAKTGQALTTQAPFGAEPAGQAQMLCATMDAGEVAAKAVRQVAILAYDDIKSIRYFKADLAPYWRRDGLDAAGMLQKAWKEFPELEKRCGAFDKELMDDMAKAGGADYATLCALAYRQALAACKLAADPAGQPLFFPKENHSNGCIATVDVFYPMAPQPLLFSPALTKATVEPILDYSASSRWKFPFAPHDLGQYPYATGQVYGDGEKGENNQMPVEESADMILIVAALADVENDTAFAEKHWAVLEKWAAYLEAKGFDPENQLCTDDFAGHLAHNVNLSAKAIVALGAFGQLSAKCGKDAEAKRLTELAQGMVKKWVEQADAGDHFRLAFDKPDSWSQKYNIVWDRVLGLKLFPESAMRKEMDFYKRNQKPYGLPLDNRETYTKLDWITWTAAITGNREDFEALIKPIIKFLNETPDRAPMGDWYYTDSAKKQGFTARPVVGGVFMQALCDAPLWQKWAKRGENTKKAWAPLQLGEEAKK
ncbi:MAG TPA: DUF4965 domain-containing protein [Candidatus Sumerlaeota bacterium]|nr:DUF4965 domain-containing protein [Candidatus Sumerlaeota bacterium]